MIFLSGKSIEHLLSRRSYKRGKFLTYTLNDNKILVSMVFSKNIQPELDDKNWCFNFEQILFNPSFQCSS